eukprot:14631697-Alexandrium_andersonii.AAC.1
MATAHTAARRPDERGGCDGHGRAVDHASFAGRACSSGLDLVVYDAARPFVFVGPGPVLSPGCWGCLLYTSDAADDM